MGVPLERMYCKTMQLQDTNTIYDTRDRYIHICEYFVVVFYLDHTYWTIKLSRIISDWFLGLNCLWYICGYSGRHHQI